MTDYLLDTHVLLWANGSPERLGPATTSLLLDQSNHLLVSSVSAAEISIKRTIGKLTLNAPLRSLMDVIDAHELPLTIDHAESTLALPLLHRDPFDRLLIAQAISEGVGLISADAQVLAYPVVSIDARR